MSKEKTLENLSYEEAITELEAVVEKMKNGELTVDAMMTLFERGQKLSAHCADLLNQAELKVKTLTDGEAD